MYVRHSDSWHSANTYNKASWKTAKPRRIYCEDMAINIKIISTHFYRSLFSIQLRQSLQNPARFYQHCKALFRYDCLPEIDIRGKNFTTLKQEEIDVTFESSFNKIHSEQRKQVSMGTGTKIQHVQNETKELMLRKRISRGEVCPEHKKISVFTFSMQLLSPSRQQ